MASVLAAGIVPGPRAAAGIPVVELRLDRFTYVDGAYRDVRHGPFVWLGFDAARASEAAGADVPGTQTAYTLVPGPDAEHFESVTVDLRRAGDLVVEMVGRRAGTLVPQAVPGSANRGGKTKGPRVTWRVRDAEPGSYTFTARFRPRATRPSASTFLPEARIALTSYGRKDRLVLVQHVAPAYGPPDMSAGVAHEPTPPVAHPDEWVADPAYVAQGNYNWVTGEIAAVDDLRLSSVTPDADDVFTSASIGSGVSSSPAGPKVLPYMDFTYGKGGLTGFLHGAVTADALGWFPPYDTRPTNGMIYDGDAATFAIGMSAASVHGKEKRAPARAGGELEWDWDGGWADGWSTKDEHAAPGMERAEIRPTMVRETVVYARAERGDVDNRKGSRPVRGPRATLSLPAHEFGFIFVGTSAPAKSNYRARIGFTDAGVFYMQPTIRPGGYMLEHTTDGYFRDWQAAEMLSVILFEAQPEEDPGAKRLFTFAPGTRAGIVAATTEGTIERFDAGPGIWELTATLDGFEVRPLRLFDRTPRR